MHTFLNVSICLFQTLSNDLSPLRRCFLVLHQDVFGNFQPPMPQRLSNDGRNGPVVHHRRRTSRTTATLTTTTLRGSGHQHDLVAQLRFEPAFGSGQS
jgi:hypothetical protein